MTSTFTFETRPIQIPIAGGELTLAVPTAISEPVLIREIAIQDVVRGKLLDVLDRLVRNSASNRELLLCSWRKLQVQGRELLEISSDLGRIIHDLGTYHSAIPELEEARGDVQAFFARHVRLVIDELNALEDELFRDPTIGSRARRSELLQFRKKLAKSSGIVYTELQKIFAHLFARDPRNLYRQGGPRSQQEILFRQFRRDVEITAELYAEVRRMDRYMRGAIVPSDLLQMIAGRIEREHSVACLFDSDYHLFLSSLVDEVLEILLPELEEVLQLDGIWYDDFENIEQNVRMLRQVCIAFRALYDERISLHHRIVGRITIGPSEEEEDALRRAEAIFETHRYQQFAERIRRIDQHLIDLEGTLLAWEKGVAKRAFAQEGWSDEEPLARRGQR